MSPLLPRVLGRIPRRFQPTLHNIVGHPVSEVLFQIGSDRWSNRAQDLTVPVQHGRWVEPRTDDEPSPTQAR